MPTINRELFTDSPVLRVGDVALSATDDLCAITRYDPFGELMAFDRPFRDLFGEMIRALQAPHASRTRIGGRN
jgi:hypothetical protein